MPEPTQPPNAHGGQLLPRLQAIDLRGVESQTRQGDAADCSRQIASPVLFFQAPALFQFAIGIIFNVPAGAVGLQSSKAMLPPACAHQRLGWLKSRLRGGHIADQTSPQCGIRPASRCTRLVKALPTPAITCCRHLYLTAVPVASHA